MSIEEKFKELITKRNTTPFLFIGSGLSRRYLDLLDWKGLLKQFSKNTRPFEYFLSKTEGNMPKAAKLLAKEYHKYWWTQNSPDNVTEEKSDTMTSISSPLKIDIANYLKGIEIESKITNSNQDEISDLRKANIGGIITTNWDMLLEFIFPDYKTYIGQDGLILENPQWIAEIYKIHGCASKPQSLVLTSSDYKTFNKKSKYLASKLTTIFMEHPVIFLGYSMSDPNIVYILKSLSLCLNTKQISRLKNNLIFVSRPNAKDEVGVQETMIYANKTQIPAIKIITSNFSDVYRPLGSIKQKIPTKLLRNFREQLYEITTSLEPSDKLKVIDIEKLSEHGEIEFVAGIGLNVQGNHVVAQQGYSSIGIKDLAKDILHDDQGFVAKEMLSKTIPTLSKNSPFTPAFKYLRSMDIKTESEYKNSGIKLDKIVKTKLESFNTKTSLTGFRKSTAKTMSKIINDNKDSPAKAASIIPCLSKKKIDLDELRAFLIENESVFDTGSNYDRSCFRKLLTLYDRLKWGWDEN